MIGAIRLPLRPRDPTEQHRAATPLELFTDLCYVVAIAQAALELHHAVAEGHPGHGMLYFSIAFFAIWWAWLNFAWFNSAYDSGDTVHRLLTLLQVFGSLVLAAGVPRMFDEDFTLAVVGYVIMRIGLVAMWLRAAHGHPERRATAMRYATGLVAVQIAWVLAVAIDTDLPLQAFLALAFADLLVPLFAESAGTTPWHPHHIAERYGLFFIIVLGETVLSVTFAIQEALDGAASSSQLALVVAGGVLITFCAWWLYFSRDDGEILSGNDVGYLWGFGHFFIFGSVAAVGAGLAARVEFYGHHAEVSDVVSSAFVTVPMAVFLAVIWFVMIRLHDPSLTTAVPFGVAIGVVLAVTFVPASELWVGLILAALLSVELWMTSAPEPSEFVGGQS